MMYFATVSIYDIGSSIYSEHGITFNALMHLNDIGLLSSEWIAGYERTGFPKKNLVFYYGVPINIEFQNDKDNDLEIGKVVLSKIGQELAPICGSNPVQGFIDYVIDQWTRKGLVLSSPYPRVMADNP